MHNPTEEEIKLVEEMVSLSYEEGSNLLRSKKEYEDAICNVIDLDNLEEGTLSQKAYDFLDRIATDQFKEYLRERE